MLSSEILTGGIFHTEKNLRMGKLISSTKKPHHTMKGVIWGVYDIL